MNKSAIKETFQIPGPKPANDLKGNLDEIQSCGSLHQFLEKYHKQYGPIIAFWFGPNMCISIASSKLFKEHASYFDRPRELFDGDIPLFGEDSMQFSNGEDGRRRYSAFSKSLNPTSIKNFYTIFNKLGKDLVEKWLSWPKDKYILVQEEMYHLAIKSILESLCGEELENNELVVNVKAAYDFCWSEIEKCMIGDIPQRGSSREAQFKCMLTWCIYFLATHQEVQDKVRAELLTVLGTSTEVTVEMAKKLKYLQQVLKETLRVARIATFAARVHHSNIVLGGFRVPAEMAVVHELGLSLHDESVFPHPLKFDPDRFSRENESHLPPFSFEPFGFSGKRKCPGYNFAYAEASAYLALIIRSFKIELAYDQVAEPRFGFVTKIKDDLWVIARPV